MPVSRRDRPAGSRFNHSPRSNAAPVCRWECWAQGRFAARVITCGRWVRDSAGVCVSPQPTLPAR